MRETKIPPPGRLIDIGRRRLHIDVRGDVRGRDGPVIVLEAGIAASSLSWRPVQERLAEFATVVSYDRAGLGWSEPAAHRHTARDAADDLAQLLERAGIGGPFVLAGHSFGGLIVRVFEQIYPERVAGLVLVDPVSRAEWRGTGEQRTQMLARGVRLSRRGAALARAGVVGLALRLLMSGSRTIPRLLARASAGRAAGVTERLTGEVRKMPRDLWPAVAAHWSEEKCFRAMADALESLPVSVGQIDESRLLGALPVSVLSAENAGPGAMAEHRREARLSSRGEHEVVRGSGHWIQLDAPDAVAGAIRRVAGIRPEGGA